MFDPGDAAYLLRQLSQNQVILFLGSGFSYEAKNRLGDHFPVGQALARQIWDFLGLPGKYDGTSLKEMFEVLLNSGHPHDELRSFLESHLLSREIPDIYDVMTRIYWRRIYTTNIDDILPAIYKRAGGPRLQTLSFPNDEPEERDQYLEAIQAVYLNGKLPCSPDDLIFSHRQYAKTTLYHQPFYEQFVREYSTHCTVFVGTSLEEDLVWQYIEARQLRPGGISEGRPKSFFISSNIPAPKRLLLGNYNISPVAVGVKEFLQWLGSHVSGLPDRDEILRNSFPDLVELSRRPRFDRDKTSLQEFAFSFERVPTELTRPPRRSFYLLGATPTWEDLLGGLDASRNITADILQDIKRHLDENPDLEIVAILGYAGAGKSTILRRIGIELAQGGRIVFYTASEHIPRPSTIAKALDAFDQRVVLLFDNAEIVLRNLPTLSQELLGVKRPPVVVITARTNDFDRLTGKYNDAVRISEYEIPNLSRNEINRLITVLEDNHLLGKLNGLPNYERVREFEVRAQKQILVAMREATSGKGFDEIIRDEFNGITPHEAKLLCLCTALATDAGFRITKDEFVGCTVLTPAEALHYLHRNLRGIISFSGINDELVAIRHRAIAEYYIQSCESRDQLRNAYVRVLKVLANEIKHSHWTSRVFNLYRDLINHRLVYRRFYQNLDEARKIYDSLIDHFDDDFHFWLQYGSLELEGGSLELADNYLNQAKSIDPYDNYIINAIGHLEMRKAIEASTLAEAVTHCNIGEEILKSQILNIGTHDPYCYHIYCLQKYNWIRHWIANDDIKKEQLATLFDVIKTGISQQPFNKKLAKLRETIERAYLSMAIPIDERPDDPVYTYD